MADIKWIKLSVTVHKDRKVRHIRRKKNGDTYALIWIMMLCLAGECNDNGRISASEGVPFTDEDLADEFSVTEKQISEALQIFEELGMITRNDSVICVTNWEKHQSVTQMENIKKSNTERQKRYRENQKNRNVTRNVTHNATETDASRNSNAVDIDKDIERDIDTEEEQDTYVTYGNSGTQKKREDIYNQAYRHSTRARAATAQIIIDKLTGHYAVAHPQVHEVVCHALAIGATPEEIIEIGRKSASATEFISTFMAKERWNA